MVAALVVACRHEPKPVVPAPLPRPSSGDGDAGDPPPPGADRPVQGGPTGEMVLGEDELSLLPNLRLGTVQVASGIDLTAVMDRLRAVLPALRLCLRTRTMPRPTSELTLTLSFSIDGGGQVADADLTGSEILPLRQCVASALMGTKGFPPGPARVEATLIVSPVSPAGGGGRR